MNKGATVARGDPASVQRGDLLSAGEVFAVDTAPLARHSSFEMPLVMPSLVGSEGWRQRMQAG